MVNCWSHSGSRHSIFFTSAVCCGRRSWGVFLCSSSFSLDSKTLSHPPCRQLYRRRCCPLCFLAQCCLTSGRRLKVFGQLSPEESFPGHLNGCTSDMTLYIDRITRVIVSSFCVCSLQRACQMGHAHDNLYRLVGSTCRLFGRWTKKITSMDQNDKVKAISPHKKVLHTKYQV